MNKARTWVPAWDGSRAWLWVALVLGPVLLALALVSAPQDLPNSLALNQAQVLDLTTDGAQVPGRPVKLPHFWDEDNSQSSHLMRYRLRWPDRPSLQPARTWSLLLSRVGARFQVRVNGLLIHSDHWDNDDYVDTSVVPHKVDLPSYFDPEQHNVIEIDVQGLDLRKSGLGYVVLGPSPVISSRFEHIFWWQVYLTWMVAACSGMLGLLTGLIWTVTRERMFAWLSLASLFWMVRLGLTPLQQPGMPFEVWFFVHKISFTMYCGFLYLFLWDLFRMECLRCRKLVWWMMWISPVWILLTLASSNYDGYRVWTGAFALIATWTFISMLSMARRGLDGNQKLIVVVSTVTLVAGLRDFLVVQFGVAGDADLRWMTPGSLVFMLALSLVLVQHMADYVERVKRFNEELHARIQDKEDELTQAFEQIKESEKLQVLVRERARLTRDMHDGLGSQLVQTLNAVRSGASISMTQLEHMLTHALEDLRMTLDSMESMEGDLPTILGTLRGRIAPSLDLAQVELDWAIEDVPALLDMQGKPLEGKSVMHLFRCMQEVFANIVKHARANRVRVETALGEEGVLLRIADNGIGLGQGEREGGRGMQHIRLRAKAIGARVQWHTAQTGTEVVFTFPMHAAARSSGYAQ